MNVIVIWKYKVQSLRPISGLNKFPAWLFNSVEAQSLQVCEDKFRSHLIQQDFYFKSIQKQA